MASRPCPCAVCKGQIPQKPATRNNHLERNGPFTNPASLSSQLITNPIPSQSTLERRSPASSDSGGGPFYGYPSDDSSPDLASPSIHLAAFGNREDIDPGSDSDSLSLHSYHKSDSTCSRSASPEDDMPLTSDYDEDSEMEDGNDLEIQVLEDAPDYISRERLFADTDSDEEDGLVDDDLELPPAFSEHRSLRNAYIHVFANATFHGATHVQSQIHLTSVHSALSSAQVPLDISAFARTLATVERRLGVNVDDTIIYFFVCPECWKRHHPSELKEPDFSSTCTRDNCSGQLYTRKRLASGREKRTPTKIMPFFPPNIAIQRMMRRPAKYEECNHWRKENDHGPAPPISLEDWLANTDMDLPLGDIHDGWRWRNIPAFLKREWDERRRNLKDVPLFKSPPRFVSLPCGLLLTINIDWYFFAFA
ncbi:hypothetical protein DFH07DRAFT_963042 [Mycena maculata]|uniref:Uncharacterized protein n=1 Tax=Mycena maculata TaxID=230809 RepID=A0AAD7N500_9AGAR|nr:hypothetical protein DFH07DRAFT_963042 [Mycena maculata]